MSIDADRPLIVPQEATAFAPATVANLGPGFDYLGVAVEGQGDVVTATLRPDLPGKVVIDGIEGDNVRIQNLLSRALYFHLTRNCHTFYIFHSLAPARLSTLIQGRLSKVAADNCSGIAAIETLKLLGVTKTGVALKLKKGLPLGSGLGSSAASAAAAAWAVNLLFGVRPCLPWRPPSRDRTQEKTHSVDGPPILTALQSTARLPTMRSSKSPPTHARHPSMRSSHSSSPSQLRRSAVQG